MEKKYRVTTITNADTHIGNKQRTNHYEVLTLHEAQTVIHAWSNESMINDAVNWNMASVEWYNSDTGEWEDWYDDEGLDYRETLQEDFTEYLSLDEVIVPIDNEQNFKRLADRLDKLQFNLLISENVTLNFNRYKVFISIFTNGNVYPVQIYKTDNVVGKILEYKKAMTISGYENNELTF